MTRRQLLAAMPLIARAKAALPLRVGAALPDPPFEFMSNDGPEGFDIVLMRRIAERLRREWQLVPYQGADFNGMFAGLNTGTYDCVASGTTITPGRQRIADFCTPYVISGQSLVVGVQQGNTSQPVAEELVAEHRAARVRVHAYDEIEKALGDLSTGGCGAFMKLAPVTQWFVRDRPRLKVVQEGITRDQLGICVRKGNAELRNAIEKARASLANEGVLAALIAEWLGNGATPA